MDVVPTHLLDLQGASRPCQEGRSPLVLKLCAKFGTHVIVSKGEFHRLRSDLYNYKVSQRDGNSFRFIVSSAEAGMGFGWSLADVCAHVRFVTCMQVNKIADGKQHEQQKEKQDCRWGATRAAAGIPITPVVPITSPSFSLTSHIKGIDANI